MVERIVDSDEVSGSNPLPPTKVLAFFKIAIDFTFDLKMPENNSKYRIWVKKKALESDNGGSATMRGIDGKFYHVFGVFPSSDENIPDGYRSTVAISRRIRGRLHQLFIEIE